MVEWRRARDCSALAGLGPKDRPATRNPLAGELARTKKRAERAEAELAKTRLVVETQGKASELLGAAARRERRGEQAAAVIDQAFSEVRPSQEQGRPGAAFGRSRVTHYRSFRPRRLGPRRPRPTPAQRLVGAPEQQSVLEQLRGRSSTSAPAQAWPPCWTRGPTWLRQSTMYRLLRANGEVREQRRQATHPPRIIPELVATQPERGLVLRREPSSRAPSAASTTTCLSCSTSTAATAPGWIVVEPRGRPDRQAWLKQGTSSQNIPPATLTIHADRGSSMTSKPVAVLLRASRSEGPHSRPHVSNDTLLRSRVQDIEVLPCVPRTIRIARGRNRVLHRVLRALQPLPPSLRHRPAHGGVGALRHRELRSEKVGPASSMPLMPPTRAVRQQTAIPPLLPEAAWINKPGAKGARADLMRRTCLSRLDRFRGGLLASLFTPICCDLTHREHGYGKEVLG